MEKCNRRIDGRRSWVAVAGMFMKCFICGGFLKSYGILFSAFTERFGRSAAETQLVRSVRSLSTTVTGPLGTALSERFSERAVVMTGAVIMSLGLILAFFADSLEMIIFTFGVFHGMGSSLIKGPSNVWLARHFSKRRGLANSLSKVGVPLGEMGVPLVLAALIKTYSLNGAMLIYGGITLHTVITGALMRPMKTRTRHAESDEDSTMKTDNVSEQEICIDFEPMLDKNQNTFPEKMLVDEVDGNVVIGPIPHEDRVQCSVQQIIDPSDVGSANDTDPLLELEEEQKQAFSTIQAVAQDDENNTAVCVEEIGKVEKKQRHTEYDEDYSDSEQMLYKQTKPQKCRVCAKIWTFVKNSVDLSLLKHPLFMLFAISTSLSYAASLNAMTFIVARAEEIGISRQVAAILLSLIGGCDVIGRVLLGLTADVKKLSSHHVMAMGQIVTSLSMCAIPFTHSFGQMALVAITYGLFGSSHAILNLPVMVDFVGQNFLSKAVGLSILFHGSARAVSGPLTGLLKDLTGTFSTVFLMTAGLQMMAAFLLICLEPLARRRCNRREQLKLQAIAEEEDAISPRHNQIFSASSMKIRDLARIRQGKQDITAAQNGGLAI